MTESYRKYGQIISENLKRRAELYSLIEKDQDAYEAEKQLALSNILRFFRYHAWTHDPRTKYLTLYGLTKPTIPFLLFPFQEDVVLDLVNTIQTGEDRLIEKSRDMGVTWLAVTVFLWFWLQPNAGNDFLLGSRKLDFVDKKGSQDTLFEKFRYNLYRSNFLPKGFDINKHDNVSFIANPETGSFIRGESNNANFGTSGRYKAILADEFSKWEETDESAWTSMGDSTLCRIPISTPWGLGRKFAQLRFSGAIKVATLHWSLHPLKSVGLYEDEEGNKRSIWYDEECERRKDNPSANIGQELDIDYLSSGQPYFDNILIQKRYQESVNKPVQATRYDFERISEDEINVFPHPNGRIFITKKPEDIKYNYRYCIAADVAEGLEKGDNSVFYIFDRLNKVDVAWFAGKIDTDVLALLLAHFGNMYDEAYIAPENNNHGHAVIQKLKKIYSRIMYERNFTQHIDISNEKLGWNTNVVTRPIMCADLREALNQNIDGILDLDFYNEALTFVYNKNGKPEGDARKMDDRVITQAIKFQLHRWLPSPDKKFEYIRDPYGDDDYGYNKMPAYNEFFKLPPVPRPDGAAGA